jgi:hypothetical protein
LLLARSTQHAVNARHGRNGAGIGTVTHLLLQNRINRLPMSLRSCISNLSTPCKKQDYLGAAISEKQIHSFIFFFPSRDRNRNCRTFSIQRSTESAIITGRNE